MLRSPSACKTDALLNELIPQDLADCDVRHRIFYSLTNRTIISFYVEILTNSLVLGKGLEPLRYL